MQPKSYHNKLKQLMDDYVHFVYAITKHFPDDEKFGVTSQFRRSTMSIILNYIEGFARQSGGSYNQFLKISFGSLKESEYLLDFSFKENYCSQEDYQKAHAMVREIGAMLWGMLKKTNR